jgi:glycerophosphoryl diester phosphodiesterase
MLIIGHRGASGTAPENTLASFEKAIRMGVKMIELDVHRCASGELVVIHDEKINRTTS